MCITRDLYGRTNLQIGPQTTAMWFTNGGVLQGRSKRQDPCCGAGESVSSCVMKQPAETTTANEAKQSTFLSGFIVWPFVILFLYVLSTGPVLMMIEKGRIPPDNEFVNGFYSPFGWAYRETLFHKPVGIYLHLWSRRFDKNGDPVKVTAPNGPTNSTTTNQDQGK